MEQKSHGNCSEKVEFTYSEIHANTPISQTNTGDATISFSNRSENAQIQMQAKENKSDARGSLTDHPIYRTGDSIDNPAYVGFSKEANGGFVTTPHSENPTVAQPGSCEVPVSRNNTNNNGSHVILNHAGINGGQQVAKLTWKEMLTKLPYKLMVVSLVTGAVLALLLVVPSVVVSMTKDTNSHDSQKCWPDNWSNWTKCSTSCGRGVQIRRKKCSYGLGNTEFRQCLMALCDGDDGNLNLLLDQSTAHSSCFLSTDNRMVSNFYSSETPVSPNSAHQLQNYRGVIGQPCITPGQIVYYEIGYSYNIFSPNFSSSGLLVLDFGLAERHSIDSYHHIGDAFDNEWVFSMYKCKHFNNICFTAQYIFPEKEIKISNSSLGTLQNGSFGIFVDRRKGEISLYDISRQNVFHRFDYIISDLDLCPVFGAGYNSHSVHVTIKLFNSYSLFPILDNNFPSSIRQVIKSLIIY